MTQDFWSQLGPAGVIAGGIFSGLVALGKLVVPVIQRSFSGLGATITEAVERLERDHKTTFTHFEARALEDDKARHAQAGAIHHMALVLAEKGIHVDPSMGFAGVRKEEPGEGSKERRAR